jgi:hypothetical protein
MLELPTQPSPTVRENANVHAIIGMKQYDDDTTQQISENKCGDPGVPTLSSDIKEDDLGNQQKVLQLGEVRHDKTIRTSRVPLPKIWSHAVSVIARTSLPNMPHQARAIAPPLLKRQKLTTTTM